MMETEEEKWEALVRDLASVGFEGVAFEQELRRLITLNLPGFILRLEKEYGLGKMIFDLHFSTKPETDYYALQRYKATLRLLPEIWHRWVDGISTSKLETQMASLDWTRYFEDGLPEKGLHDQAASLLSDLRKIGTGGSPEGLEIQGLLMLNYFPERIIERHDLHDRMQYEQSNTFYPDGVVFKHANLAYNILSGRLGDLTESLELAGFNSCENIDIEAMLAQTLTKNPKAFELNFSVNSPNGIADFTVPIQEIGGYYHMKNYTVSLTLLPELPHQLINGIDTQSLESAMRKIDWHDDSELFIFREDEEPGFFPDVEKVQADLHQMSQVEEGAAVARLLQLKYWTGSTFHEGLIEDQTWEYLASLPKLAQQFSPETSAKAGLNLLYGRPVMEAELFPSATCRQRWVRLGPQQHKPAGSPFIYVEGYNAIQLYRGVDMLPVGEAVKENIFKGLQQGDLVSAKLKNGAKVIIEARPETSSLKIYTPERKEIPVNILFDPQWISPAETINTSAQRQGNYAQEAQNKAKQKKHKGRGL